MHRGAIALLAILVFGCAGPTVLVIPGFGRRPAPESLAQRMPEGCRYSSIAVTHAQAARDLMGHDLSLSARVAELMRREFERRGASIVREHGDAYWSLMVLAAHDERHHEGFLFSATLGLRDLREGRDPGIAAYVHDPETDAPATMYTGLGYGPGYALESTVREFVRRADRALLPVAHGLCAHEARERSREAELEAALPVPL